MKKIAKILLIAMLFSLFATACGSTAPEVFDMDFTMNSSGMDLEGVTIKYIRAPIFGAGNNDNGEVLGYESGTVLADIAMQRIRDIEKNLNFSLEIDYSSDKHDTFQMSNFAGVYLCDIFCGATNRFREDMKAGLLVGLSTVGDYIDYRNTEKWGNGNILEDLCWEDDVYGLIPLSWPMSSVSYTGLTVVNEDLIASLNATDPRDLYESGEWTWETFRKCLEQYYAQEGSDVKHYALSAAPYNFGANYILSNGFRVAEKGADGNYQSGFRSPEALKAMEEALDVYNGSISYTIDHTDDILQGPIDALINGTAVMGIMHYAEYVPNRLAKEMTNFGVLPWPSGPDVEPGFIAPQHTVLERAIVIPRFSPNVEAATIVLNALYEPFEEYPNSDSIKDFLYNTFFFDRRDAEIYYDMFLNNQCSYFTSPACDALGGWLNNGQTPTAYIEANIDKIEEYIEKEIFPSKRGVEAVWGE